MRTSGNVSEVQCQVKFQPAALAQMRETLARLDTSRARKNRGLSLVLPAAVHAWLGQWKQGDQAAARENSVPI